MLKKNLYTCLLLAAVLLLAKLSFGQCATDPSLYTTLPVGVNVNVMAGSSVCPSTTTNPSTSVFSVPAVIIDAGVPASNTFEWAVYGGWIRAINGTTITDPEELLTAASVRYSCISTFGIAGNNTITVEWDTTNYSVVHGWVAVRQTSEYGCSDGNWSVYTNDIQNLPPDFNTPIATIILPNTLGVSNYTLPIPLAADQDACSGPLSFSFQILDNLGTVLQPTTLVENPGTENTLVLPTDTNHVVWTVSDGGRIDTTSYYIIVEPELDILKVALINPNCGTAGTPATNGSAYVTDYTHYNFTTAVQYRYDGGAWGNVPAMGAGSYTIQAGLFYNVDLNGDAVANDADDGDWVLSPVYSYTLEETSYSSVDNIPTDAPDVTVVDASCLSSNDGIISISTADAVIGSLNNSVSFNGTSSYLALNKSYNTTSISSFSVAAWIKTSASSGTILSFNGDAYFNLALSAGRVQLTAQPSSGAGTTVTAQTVVADGLWHLVTATYNGSEYNLFLDTLLVETLPGSGNIGIGLPYYGMIGARSGATDFGQAPTGFYFDGQIAEVGIWDNGALTRDNVISMFTSGMGSLGPSDRWVLNDVPDAAETVFVDLGNGSNTLNWGRFVNCSVVTNDAPKLYSWVDIPTLGVATRNDLKAGSSYTFQVRDVYGCGLVEHTYTIGNSDTDAPLILWNVAVGKPATQSSLTNASLASDGFFSTPSATSSEANPWWDISLNGNYPIPMVRITANSTLTNAYVIVSPSQIAAASLADYLALPGIEFKQLSLAAGTTGFVTFDDDVWGTYVRIWANETTSLSLGEVEVLTNQQPPDTRHLYLDTDCDYPLSGDDATVDLVAYDVCGGPTTIVNSIDNDASITGLTWPPIGSGYDVTWTATDEVEVAGVHTNTSSLLMHYEVADSVFPKFVESPFTGVPTNFTACQALTYQFPIPKVTDNLHDCAPYQYINLYVDGWLAYEYPEADLQNLTYYNNYSNPGLANAIPSLMDPDNVVVEHTIRWEIRDAAGNMIFEELEIEIEPEPKIREIKVSPISCPGSGNGFVYFSKYDGDAMPTSIQFILRNTVSGTEISSGSSPVAAPAGVYQAFININGCPSSDPYPFDVELNQPGDIELVVDTTHVICYGLGDGAIDIEPSGGSETNVLHLWDGGSVGAGDDPAVNIATEGMIECWMFLDSLASGGTNWDATIFSAGTFGLRMAGGQLEFFASGNSAFPSTTISQRVWYHVAGAIHSGLLELYLDGSMIASQPLDAATLPLDGAGIAIGPLNGFVRNARIWNAFPASFGENINMSSPIDITNNLVANFPINAAGGTTVTNVVNGTYSGAVAGNNSRQQFAYYWTDPDGLFLDFTQDIKNVVAGNYKVILYDPQGCPPFEDEIEVKTADDVAPTMTFYSDHARSIELGIGQNIIRTTTQTDWGNAAGDCAFVPSALEFDPKVSDGICPVTSAYVTLSYSVVAGTDPFLIDPPSTSSLDGGSLTGITTLLWSAKDLTNPATTMEVTYYIVDNGTPGWYANFPDAPTVSIQDTIVYVPAGSCQYTVQPGECLAYVDDDCNTGILKNNLNGENNLDGYKLDLGTYDVTWTYTDRIFPGQTAPTPTTKLRRITVVDNTAPTVACTSPGTVYLDDNGQASLTVNDLVSSFSDNCTSTTPTLVVTKNIANGMGAAYVTQSSDAVDGEAVNAVDNTTDPVFANGSVAMTNTEADPSWWQVDLNGAKTIYGVRLFASSAVALSNFWIVVSNDGNFAPPADFTDDNTTWGANIVYRQHVTSAIAGSQFFSFSKPVVGSTVRIWNDHVGQLSLAEVEVYGVGAPSQSVMLDCVDARYTPNADPRTGGTIETIGVLLSAVDASQNAFSCWNDVLLTDDINPSVGASVITVSPDNNGVVTIDAAALGSASTDNCEVADYWTTDILDCDDSGTSNVTLYVMDEFGNQSSELVPVTVDDNVLPVARAKATVIIELDDQGQFVITPAMARAFLEGTTAAEISTDNCNDIVYAEVVPNTFSCNQAAGAFVPLTYTVTDGSNNVSLPFTIQADVQDNMMPTPSIQNFNLTLSKAQNDVILVSDFDAGGYDNCGLDYVGIYFDTDDPDNLCIAGTEGSAGDAVVAPRASIGSLSADHNPHSGTYPLANATDDGFTATAYVTELTTAGTDRTVTLAFPAEYNISQSSVYWDKANLTSSGSITTMTPTSRNNMSGFAAGNLKDGNYMTSSSFLGYPYFDCTGCYITGQGSNGADDFWVTYNFGSTYTITSTNVHWLSKPAQDWPYWDNPSDRIYLPNSARFQTSSDGVTYTNVSGVTLTRNDGDNIINFSTPITTQYLRIVFDEGNYRRCGIEEWAVTGYAGPRQYDGVTPSTATVEYRNTISGDGVWRSFAGGNQGVAYPNVNTVSVPVASAVSATAMRLRFRNATETGYLGIKDWEVWGSKVGATSYCKTWTCSDVGTHEAHIVYVAKSGQQLTVHKTFQVLPYFTIDDIQLKDCAVTGEQYWSWYTNLPDSYTFLWEKVPQSGTYILSDGIGSNTGVHSWSSTSETIAQLRVSDDNYRSVPNGEYTIRLTVTDNANDGCKVTRDMTFTARDDLNVNRSIEEFYVCKGDEETFTMELVVPNTYYGSGGVGTCENYSTCQDLFYNWDYSEVSYVSGGTVKDPTVKVSFPSVGTFDVECGVSGNQRFVQYGNGSATAFPTVVPLPVGTTMNCSGSSPCFNFGTDFIGPFNFSDAQKITNNNNYDASGKNVVKISTSSGYYQVCDEGKIYRVTVYDVATPTLVDPVLEVCPFEQVTYTTSLTGYENYKWTITGGRKVSGGGGSDLDVEVEWNMDGWPAVQPKIELEVTNTLGCKASNSWNITYDQTPGISITPSANLSHDADANSCAHTFPSITLDPTLVVMPNSCEYKSLECSTDGGSTWKTNAAGTYTGIGDHTILWRARDYFWAVGNETGHEATWTQTLTIVDKQPPSFNNSLSVLPLETNGASTTCDVLFNQNTRDVTATDGGNCTPAASLVYTCELDRNDGNGWVNSPLLSKQTINGITFGVGTTRVRYTVSDNATPPNTAVAEFNVVVKDRTNPTIVDPSVSIANITQATDAGADSATVVVTPPSGAALWDNCTALANLVVTGTRSDGLALTKRYPVGVTTITWVVRDEANNPLPSNPLSYTQTITVGDEEDPTFTDLTEFTAKTISYCSRIGYKIAIPTSFHDNVGVVQLDYKILDVSNNPVTGGSGSIKKSVYPNFKPNGTNFLDGFDIPGVDKVNGSNFTVIWTAVDAAGNRSVDNTYSYNLHVEMEPNFTEWTTNVDCNGATITVTEITDNSEPLRFRYDRDHGYDAYYNIGTGWTTNTSFSVPGTGTYTLRMQVNGCEAPKPISIPVSEAEPYRLSTEKTDVDCPEQKTGTVDLTMTGGVSQLLLSGSGYTATYDQLNLGAQGAVEAWVYLDNLVNTTILSRSTYGLGLSTAVVDGKTVGYFNLFVGSDVLTSSFVVAAHRWYHVSGSWDGSNMTITIDETANDSQVSSQSATGANSTAFVMGAGFSGMLREVSVWSAIPAGFGAIRNAGNKIQGNETGLVGFWDLGGGSGTEAKNRCGSYYAWAKDATGADTWASNMVQPGFYTWTKATATASGTYSTVGKSNINLTELDTATYTVSFVDPYGCAAANTSFEKIIATDDELPVIDLSGISTTHLLTPAGSCEYKFTDPDVVSNYVPIITESSNCNYKIKWQVIVDHDLGSWIYEEDSIVADENVLNKILGSTLGRKGTNGKNTVYITLSQNGLLLDPPVSYDIYLDDKIFPVAGGKTSTPSMNLDASGVVVYTALQHNDPLITEDNCSDDVDMLYEISSDGATWGPSINFNCDDIGQDVNVWFRVTDESNNTTTVATTITNLVVSDVTPPQTNETSYQPLGPYCADVDADLLNGVPAYVDIPLNALTINRYTDNCGVYRISYKRDYDHLTYFGGDDLTWQIIDQRNDLSETIDFNPATLVRFYEGKTTVTFQLTDGDPDVVDEADRNSTEQPIFVVTVLPKPKPGDGSGGGIN